MQPIEPLLVGPLEAPPSSAVGVPRRFGLAAVMLMMTLAAVILAILRSLDANPWVFVVVAVMFVGVAAAQVLLFGGKKPREASLLAGAVLFPLSLLGAIAFASGRGNPIPADADVCFGMACAVPAGIVLGYGAGVLTAGVFLILSRWERRGDPPRRLAVRLEPFTADDAETAAAWLAAPALVDYWSGGLFSHPVDREQWERHLEPARREPPALYAFKAVETDTGRMIGYVELAEVDRPAKSALLRLPLVAPGHPDRDHLSLALLRAVLREAFVVIDLHRVSAAVCEYDTPSLACFRRAGFVKEGMLRSAMRVQGRFASQVLLGMLAFEWRWRVSQQRL
jgi:RimJ/RimL family protein N-acetyltransferase